jgi:hypothetical protein
VTNFQMPGALLIPDYEKRVQIEGVGLTRQQFLSHAIVPTLRAFGTTRSELVKVLRATKERAQAGEPALEGLAAGVEARRDRAHAA